jgi:hypothetical protein
MSTIRKTVCIATMIGLLVSTGGGSALAQTSNDDLIITDPGDTSTGLARDNVRGGALGERRPGNRVQAAITRHVNYTNLSLPYYGDLDPGPEPEPRFDFDREEFIADFITSIFDALNEIFLQMLTGGFSTSDGTNTTP